MWLNDEKVSESAIDEFRELLLCSCPHHVVIDGLFDETKLDEVVRVLQKPDHWQTQKHTYSALYVDDNQWQNTSEDQRFVQRDVWQRDVSESIAKEFLSFLRGDEFLSLLSHIFNVTLTDTNVAEPDINSNYFRLGAADFVEQHADDSPGREVCLLLYLNKDWNNISGGELCFNSNKEQGEQPVTISPLYNRCVLFDPSSNGSEHWVKKLNANHDGQYRYNVTSWYWSF